MDTNGLDWLAILLVILGAVTWGILGLTGFLGPPAEELNVISAALEAVFLPDAAETVENLVYVLVGLAGVYLLYTAYKMGRASRRTTRERRRTGAATPSSPTDSESTDNTES